MSLRPETFEAAKAQHRPMKRSAMNRQGSSGKTLSASRIKRKGLSGKKSKKAKQPKTKAVQTIFNTMVKDRADWKCVRCGRDCSERKGLLHASHFWGVGFTATRFDFDNVDALCYPCHYGQLGTGWEYCKQGDYRTYMIQKLGQDGYDALEAKARSQMKLADAKEAFLASLKAVEVTSSSPVERKA